MASAALHPARGMRIFSGIQPTGVPHLGNYLGALANWVELQQRAAAARPRPDVLYCVVDLHAMTVPYDPRALAGACRATAATLLACGIDPGAGALVFRQSAVREHAELAWLLSCVTPLGWLSRMTQYKQKAAARRDASSLGLLSYPVLQAADILLYRATHVPVGEDQHQHLELARGIAALCNRRFGGGTEAAAIAVDAAGDAAPAAAAVVTLDDVLPADGGGARGWAPGPLGGAAPPLFPLPATVTVRAAGGARRVMSLRDGSAKMSKSDADDGSRINLTDSADAIAAKVRRAKTDSSKGFSGGCSGGGGGAGGSRLAGLSPEKANLLTIYAAVTACDGGAEGAAERFADASASDFKRELTDALVATVVPIGDRVRRLLADDGGAAVDAALDAGAERARAIAAGVMADVRAAVGSA